MANRAASRQKDGRWGPPGPSPLKQVTLAIRLVDDILIVKPVVVLADVLLVCTSGSAELSNPYCQPCDSLLAEPVVVSINDLPFITAEVVIHKPLVVLDKVYSSLSSPDDMVDDYVVVEPILPSNNLHLIDTTLVVAEKINSFDREYSELLIDDNISTYPFTCLVEDIIHQVRPSHPSVIKNNEKNAPPNLKPQKYVLITHTIIHCIRFSFMICNLQVQFWVKRYFHSIFRWFHSFAWRFLSLWRLKILKICGSTWTI